MSGPFTGEKVSFSLYAEIYWWVVVKVSVLKVRVWKALAVGFERKKLNVRQTDSYLGLKTPNKSIRACR